MQENKYILVVDIHEPEDLRDEIRRQIPGVEERALETGDMLVMRDSKIRAIVERKTYQDLLNSFFSGRLFTQRDRYARIYAIRYLIIEGNVHANLTTLKPEERLRLDRTVASFSIKYNVTVMHTFTKAHTAQFLKLLLEKSAESPVPAPVYIPKLTIDDVEIVWHAFPGISEVIAQRIYARYSLLDIANLMICLKHDEVIDILSEIEGVGKKKAEGIVKMFFRKKRNYNDETGEIELPDK